MDGYSTIPPYIQALELTQTDNYTVNLSVLNGNGEPADLTGGNIILTVAQSNSTNTIPVLQKTAVVTDAVAGIGYFSLGISDTSSLKWYMPYEYDITFIIGNNQAHIIPVSPFSIVKG